jgi:amino acid transporter
MSTPWVDTAQAPRPLTAPAPLAPPWTYRAKKVLLGRPLTTAALRHERLNNALALGVLSSDCISSSAYGTEEMLIVLLPAFAIAGFTILLPLTGVILVVLLLVTLSYRDVVSVYTKTGGSYVVARENFGPLVAQVAAVALMLDYIVTVAVQSAAGTDALTSAVPSLTPWSLEITVAVVLLLCFGNLRGIREAGRTFALPTYFFAGSMFLVIIIGVVRELLGDLPQRAIITTGTYPVATNGQSLLTWASVFVLLRAFANGGSSLTGLEAISNGVSMFRRPEGRNARKTLVAMSLILGTLVAGVSWLAHETHAQPYVTGSPTVISQVAGEVLGSSVAGHVGFLLVQLATMLILYTGANTPFSGFPFLASFVAEDRFLPRQLTRRGHRLAFSNGIIVLTVVSVALLIGTGAHVDKLVAFYAIGVFTGFTLAGFGMARYFSRRDGRRDRRRILVNFASGAVSLVVVAVFVVVKFTEGAWLVVVIFPIAVLALFRLNRQYRREAQTLAIPPSPVNASNIARHRVVVLVDNVDLATVAAVRYARSLRSHDLWAVHFVLDSARAERIRLAWSSHDVSRGVPLNLIDCPDRRLINAVLEMAAAERPDPGTELTLLLPRRTYGRVLGRVLHDGTADDIARATSRLPGVVATIVPFDVEGLIERREAHERAVRRRSKAIAQAAHTEATGPAAPAGVTALRPARPGPGVRRAVLTSDRTPPATPVEQLRWRSRAVVEGRVRALRVTAVSSSPSLEVELWDDTGGVTLVFYGRTDPSGIATGSHLIAEGMVGEQRGRLAIANPAYRLLADPED